MIHLSTELRFVSPDIGCGVSAAFDNVRRSTVGRYSYLDERELKSARAQLPARSECVRAMRRATRA
ncbi:MAG TPA: hypothetical protein PLL30_09090 [Candidatus Krumholzibacteria bacterium]|nr:hypothetical protein [Candidatus Krumholzibacteria bacterium]HPD71915.1 hypothetical protein [Candidatus Krumholzibacteria bacterium]HRY41152.1 hypothetical protein [Candidatus Krumholzibacteria bacterium]